MKPLALDLCTGKGGWARGLKAAGWSVIGVDVKDWGNPYVDRLVLRDVRELKGSDFPGVQLVCASPPCQEFSYRSFPFKRCRELRDTVPPDKSIWEACVRIAAELGCPLILENVRGAQGIGKSYLHPEWFMGKAAWNLGAFYFWGERPLLLFQGKVPIKGFVGGKDRKEPFNVSRTGAGKKRMCGSEKYKNRFEDHPSAGKSSKFAARAEWSAQAAMIPEELAEWIGRTFHPDGI